MSDTDNVRLRPNRRRSTTPLGSMPQCINIDMRYRELIESQTFPTDSEVLHGLVELVLDFVTHAPITDDLMDEVMQAWPRPSAPMKLWRIVVLTTTQAKQLPQGLDYPTYRYLSWTSDAGAVDRLAMARTRGGVPAVVAMTFPAEQICLDVQAFVEYLHRLEERHPEYDFDTSDLVDYADEAEIIIHHTSPLHLTAQNTRVYRAEKARRPKVGELVYRPHRMSEDGSPIKRVVGKNDNGSWRVEWYGGENDVRYAAPGQWELIEYYG